jgi:hypothetical protein
VLNDPVAGDYHLSICCNPNSKAVEGVKKQPIFFHVTDRASGKVDCFVSDFVETASRLIGSVRLPPTERIVDVFYPSEELTHAKHILLGELTYSCGAILI